MTNSHATHRKSVTHARNRQRQRARNRAIIEAVEPRRLLAAQSLGSAFGDAGEDYFDEFDYNDDILNGGSGTDTARRDSNNCGADDLLISIERTIGISRFPD